MLYAAIYLISINVFAFLLMLFDKKRALKRKRRVPEFIFFALAVLCGSIGVLAAMDILRHKTRHRRFTIGIPVILAVQVVAVVFLYYFS